MTTTNARQDQPDQPRESVFGKVDQEAVISRLEDAAEDDAETSFFDRALSQPQPDAGRVFQAGVEVMGGLVPAEPSDGRRGPSLAGGRTWQSVSYTGRIADDPVARRSFILHGPAGVARTA